jgi:hypothetical protein
MRLLPGSEPVSSSTARGRRKPAFGPLAAAVALGIMSLAAVGLVGAGPVTAANPTMSPFVPGRHVYDYGNLLSATSVKAAEAYATDIQAAGGGLVVIYTVATPQDSPDETALAEAWHVDGMLLTGQGDYATQTIGATLTAKLTSGQAESFNAAAPGEPTVESWMMSLLARVDGFVRGTHVFDGTGLLDSATKQKAESAANDLSSKLGAPVYVDIALGGSDPTGTSVHNASINYSLGTCVVISLAVSGNQVAGYVESDSSLYGTFHAEGLWLNNRLTPQTAAGGDVPAELLKEIDSIHQYSPSSGSDGGGGIDFQLIFWIVFAIVMVIIGVGSPFYGSWLIGKLTGVTGPIKGGLPGNAVIESITDTGTTVSMPSVGPDAPEYKFGLQVTPAAGGAPYHVDTKALVPRLFIPMVVPGAQVGVLIDPTDPMKVSMDFSQMGGSGSGSASDGGVNVPVGGPGGMAFNFDAGGRPTSDVSALVGAVRSGALATIKGSAAQLLATGTHGTAVITTCQPMGKTVRDINPAAEASHLNDPMWLFTVEVTLAGQNPFPAVFGHRVPIDKVAAVAPGVKLAVAVDESNKNQDVAIDWDRSPLAS